MRPSPPGSGVPPPRGLPRGGGDARSFRSRRDPDTRYRSRSRIRDAPVDTVPWAFLRSFCDSGARCGARRLLGRGGQRGGLLQARSFNSNSSEVPRNEVPAKFSSSEVPPTPTRSPRRGVLVEEPSAARTPAAAFVKPLWSPPPFFWNLVKSLVSQK